ncbi:DUF541 domain-containing protein [Erythrobacter litoralis]|uniref:SIMPL domain-containing protein n=1 Tax=Erythrobacter litoralis TaxID=39960 RepID=UPI0024352C89|nr:SIMPL domain-containing protein [Erythrobacter litoralis]MDG6079995.1 DUF541 domain-containing protein [Erythrobacter litoralis]
MLKTFFSAAALAGFASAAHAAEVRIAASGPVVDLTVMEEVDAAPDLVTISAGVQTDADTAVSALRQNSEEMRNVIERIRSLGIADEDIQTTGISVNARYDFDQANRRQIFLGYTASNRVSVKLREVDDTGEVLDALVSAGANEINGPSFSLENDEELKAQARSSAMERAESQAMEYARLAGFSGLRLLEVNETITGNMPMPATLDAAQNIVVTGSRVKAPVQPGQVTIGVTVTVKYEMTR